MKLKSWLSGVAWPFRAKSGGFTVVDLQNALIAGPEVKSGVAVNWTTALQVSTVFACLRVLAEGIAQVPLKLMVSADGRVRQPAKDHPLYFLLHRKPNDWMTSFELREMMVLHAGLTGNAYCFVSRVGGRIAELIPLQPGDVTVKVADDWSRTYVVRSRNGTSQTFPADAIWHLRGPSWNGVLGADVLKLAREAVGLSIATEAHHARQHANGAKPGGMLSVEGALTDAQHKQLRKWIDDEYRGVDNDGKTMIVDRNAKWTGISLSGVDAQHLETRRFQIEEVCRFFRVMPIMVGLSDKAATYASAEQMFLAHVVHTLTPWYERIEQSIDAFLLTDADRRAGHYAKFIVAGLLRGALKDTAEYIYRLVGIGVLTRNEGRDALDKNPIDGLDEPLTPVNLGGLDNQGGGNAST
ncbi:phage portal protein [Jeongeupia sp. USM3]|uniref:phage portal protein n=1 Tax=Jeongeupia sp. USM3 TaxID=1906741 RepID=UPI00089DFB38|nr:phage portal protein [Jeongeupia sp. USM3]AOY00110.1 phage portal protein [Jeongeupia sp. USM3]